MKLIQITGTEGNSFLLNTSHILYCETEDEVTIITMSDGTVFKTRENFGVLVNKTN